MSDLLFLIVLLVFIIIGFYQPVVAMMGYIWVDLVKPQSLAYGFMSGKPLSMVIAMACLLTLFFNMKKLNKMSDKRILILLCLFATWITVTTITSLFPEVAWVKWDWAFKTIVVAAIIPFTIKTKEDLEAFMWVFIASLSFFTISAGVKTFLGGGGYGARLISGGDNTGLSESSTLALAAVMSLPILVHLFSNSLLMKNTKIYKVFVFALICTSILTVMGSFARTGLIGLAVFAFFMFIKSKKKVRVLTLFIVLGALIYNLAPDAWFARMSTVENASEDSSALGRIVVWKWTAAFATEHLFGGGFHAYLANSGLLNLYHDNENIVFGTSAKAFHSIYFEVLGEHGYIGLAIFLSIIGSLFLKLKKISKTKVDLWEGDLSKGLTQSLWIFCICGSFVGVAFQPLLYILTIIVISLSNLKNINE